MGNYMISLLFIVIIFFLLSLLIYPLAKRKFEKDFRMLDPKDIKSLRSSVFAAANDMLSSRRVLMSFNDDESLYALLAILKDRLFGDKHHNDYSYFNFPIAYLMLGILDHYDATKNEKVLRSVVQKCDNLLDEAGFLKFSINKIDQATFGLVFLKLYELKKEVRYLTGAKQVYEELQAFKRDDGLYRYRLGIDVYFIDTVGLLCPFLVRYAEICCVSSALADADNQVNFALSSCVEPHYGLVYHAFDLDKEQPLGSVNWARGLGWFLLGLSAVVRDGGPSACKVALHRYAVFLENIKDTNNYWPQFLGHTNDMQIDSSGTLMFIYALQKSGVWTPCESQLIDLAKVCVDYKGRVAQSTGDTIYLNKYSRIKGPSELSQGLMLSVLSGLGP